jgi:hypothetical protein
VLTLEVIVVWVIQAPGMKDFRIIQVTRSEKMEKQEEEEEKEEEKG